jgi:glucose/arabinose dehydrogenase
MKPVSWSITLAVALVVLNGCSKDDKDNKPESPSTGKPVETKPANTTYQPAFTGQTRINGVRTSAAYQSTVLTSSLTAPWGITSLPDGRLLITEKAGRMRIVTTTGSVGNAITGIPAVNAAGQGGLLGVTVDPQFTSNRMVYWVFSESVSGGTVTAVAKGRLADNEASIENATVIYRANPAFASDLHYGGRILFDKTGNLFVSTGERSILAARPSAQSVTAALGKIIRITTSGAAASGNPTFSGAGALPELYSIGHRNPQGIAIHPKTGELWESEHGPRGGDEINRVRAGANYGWPTITYGIEYSGAPIGNPPIQQKEGMEQPVYYWDPVISPSGMTFYKGNRIAEWENDLFIGALSGTHIARLVFKDNMVVGEERLLENEGQRFRDITQGKDEALYAITDGGRLYRIDKQN